MQLPAKAVMALQAEAAADRAEEKQRQMEREARAEIRQESALRQALLRDQARGVVRTPQEILDQERHGRSHVDVLAEAAEKMQREDDRAKHQAWLRGEGPPPPEVLDPPEQAPPLSAIAAKPRVPVRLKIRQALSKMGKAK